MLVRCELCRRRSVVVAVAAILFLATSAHGLSRVSMTEDGGYSNIVIKIRKEISEDDCPDILRGIKVLTTVHAVYLFRSNTKSSNVKT